MRIQGITIPDNKRLEIGLTTIYGIGPTRSKTILNSVKIGYDTRPTEITEDQENAIRALIEGYTTEGNLKRQVAGNVKRLKDIASYRGSRHEKRLPTRGQRTKTNSRTMRGNVRKTMGSGRVKVSKT